jgi:hypothetical protein
MDTIRNFEGISGKFNVVGICISGNYIQKLIINYTTM